MDFKDWKKIKEDGKTCTLRHPKGHTMIIAVKALPRIHQEQIKRLKMAEGGETPVQMPDKQKARDAWEGAQHGEMDRLKSLIGLGPAQPQPQQQQRQGYADGSDETVQPSDKAQPMPPTVVINTGAQSAPPPMPAPSQAPMVPPAKNSEMMKAPQSSIYRDQIPQPLAYNVNPAKNAPNLINPDNTANIPAAVNQEQQAIQDKSEIEKAQARAVAAGTTNYLNNQQMIANQQAQHYNEVKQATDAFANYVDKNPLRENAYLEDGGTKHKVATAIGLALGGFGTAFGGTNYAMDFLNKQIDRNIAAQKERTDQQKTVYGFYHNLYNDSNVATALAKASSLDMLSKEIELQAARNGDALSAQRAKEASAKMMQEKYELLKNASGLAGTLGGGNAQKQMQPQNQQNAPPQGAVTPQENGRPRYQILSPDADRKIMGIQYGPLKEKEGAIQTQYQQAAQAEKLLNGPNNDGVGGIDDIFKQMQAAAKKSEIYGHLHRTAGEALEQIPVVGQALGAASSAIPATRSENAFNNAQVQLETDMGTALNGIMTPTEIHKLVQKTSPTLTDSDEDVLAKSKTMVDSVKKAVKTKLLEQANMVKKEK